MNDDPRLQHVSAVTEPAVRAVVEAWKRAHPSCFVLALLPEAEAARLPAVQAACREVRAGLLGGIFPRLILGDRFVSHGVWLFRLDEEPLHAFIDDLAGGAEAAAKRAVAKLTPALGKSRPADTLFLLFDATTPNIATILDEIYLEIGTAVRYVGANAGSETFQPMPCLFDGERVVTGGALWMLLPGGHESVLLHDYLQQSESSIATSASSNRIVSVDFRPAFEFYRDRVRERCGAELTRDNFYRFAVEYPFAIQLANGQLLVRMPVALDDDGAIRCSGEVPEHSLLVIAGAPVAGSPETGRMLAAKLAEQGVSRVMLMFYCAGRRMRLGDASEADVRAILSATERVAAGALSLGEIGSVEAGSYPAFHNGALVCIGWAPR